MLERRGRYTNNINLKRQKDKLANEEAVAARGSKRATLAAHDELHRLLLHTSVATADRLRHCVVPALNVNRWPLQSSNELRQYPRCSIGNAQPIFVSKSNGGAEVEPCHRKLYAQASYNKRLLSARSRYLMVNKSSRQQRTLEKQGIYNRNLFQLAERLHTSPDAYFSNSFDNFFTGGNLCALPHKKQWLLHADGAHLNNLNASRLSNKQQIILKCQRAHKSHKPIYELRALVSYQQTLEQPTKVSLFAARQRDSISIYELQRKEQSKMKQLIQFKANRTPFISLAQHIHDASKLLVSSLKQQISVYDLNAAVPSLHSLYELDKSQLKMSWNILKSYAQPHCLLYANERKFCLMDLRSTPAQWLQSACTFASDDMPCDFICNLQASNFEQLVYVATNHKLHLLDMRCLGKSFNQTPGAVCSWTHQLNYAPLLMQTFQAQQQEFIALSSAIAGDMCICELTKKSAAAEHNHNIYRSYCLPYQPPTLQEAYDNACLQGYCLQPELALKQRIRYCTTGLAFFGDPTNALLEHKECCAALLSSNSIGDIFMHRITKRKCDAEADEERIGKISDEIMLNYGKHIEQRQQELTLNYTSLHKMKIMRKIFRCSRLDTPEEDTPAEDLNWHLSAEMNKDNSQHIMRTLTKSRPLGRWQKSLTTLHSYKDALASDLLAIWDIDDKPGETTGNATLKHLNAAMRAIPEPMTIVSSWLNGNDEAQKQFCENINYESNLFADNWPENINELVLPEAQLPFTVENEHLNVSSHKRKRLAKREKSYVKGF